MKTCCFLSPRWLLTVQELESTPLGVEINAWINVAGMSVSCVIQFSLVADVTGLSVAIHQNPVSGSCDSGGAVFDYDEGAYKYAGLTDFPVGALSTKHDLWQGKTIKVDSIVDNTISLVGPNSLLDRSLVVSTL